MPGPQHPAHPQGESRWDGGPESPNQEPTGVQDGAAGKAQAGLPGLPKVGGAAGRRGRTTRHGARGDGPSVSGRWAPPGLHLFPHLLSGQSSQWSSPGASSAAGCGSRGGGPRVASAQSLSERGRCRRCSRAGLGAWKVRGTECGRAWGQESRTEASSPPGAPSQAARRE